MKKKKTERTHGKLLPVRVSDDLIKLFRRAAAKDNRSLSNWVRDRLERAAARELGEQ
jgi:uncharacterized protein (DUF1778 family)